MDARRLILGPVVVLCALAALSVVSAPALAARGHVFEKTFGQAGSGNGELSEPRGVAVNESSGDVYVVDKGNDRVERFSATGAYEGQFDGSGTFEVKGTVESGTAAGFGGKPGEVETGRFSSPEGIAVDDDQSSPSFGDVYVVDTGHSVIDKFSSTGSYEGQLTGTCASAGTCPGSVIPFSEIAGVAVGSNGVVWVEQGNSSPENIDSFSDAVTNEFASSLVSGAHFGFAQSEFAVDSKDNFYVNESFGFAKLNSSGEELSGFEHANIIDTEPLTGVAVELATNDVYIDNITTVARFTSEGALLERFGAGQLREGSGVGVNSATEAVYVADSAADAVDIFPQEPPASPTIESESASDATSTSVTFDAQINPRGASTEYRFEYGECSALAVASCSSSGYSEGVPTPDGSVGSGFPVVAVTEHVQDLLPHSTYHFRVVAHSELGTVESQEGSFTTQAVGGELPLPDGRQWEMVSPPDKYGALFTGIGYVAAAQASVNGDAMTYFAFLGSTEADPQGVSLGGQVLSTRGSAGWSSKDIATPHDEPTELHGSEYPVFSEDFSRALVEPSGSFAPLTACSSSGCESEAFPEATESTLYLRNNFTCTSEVATCYEPLLTGAKGYADVPAGVKFGESDKFVGGAAPDLAHLVLASNVALTTTPTAHQELYEWSADTPASERFQLVSILPKGEGGGPVESQAVWLGSDEAPAAAGWRPISDDGSHVFWSNGITGTGGRELYMRDTVKGETIRLDVQQPGAPGGGTPEALFQAASSNGSKAFFTDRSQQLTAQSGKQGSDLYECEIMEEAGALKCKLTDLTPESAGQSAEVQQILPGTSEDGSYVYFVANGVLAPGATPGTCKEFAPTKANVTCNLYVYHDGVTTFIAALSQADEYDWGGEDEVFHGIGWLTARVSPDGRYMTFMSDRSLTGYDNSDAVTGKPDDEVYLYDAESNKLVCASCDPTGSRPVGIEAQEFGTFGVGTHTANLADVLEEPGTGIAANLPRGDVIGNNNESRYQPRYLSNSGRLFFNSDDALVSQDVNGQEDVYEYEPPGVGGVGGCTTSSTTYSERSGGCVALISSGTSYQESGFMDASETGGDVFFLTSAKLAPQDDDTALDVYDAHECTGQSPCFSTPPALPPACTNGDACKAAPTPQPAVFGAPASATFSGAGNVVSVVSKPVVKAKKPKVKHKPKKRKVGGKTKKSGKKGKKSRRAKRSKAKKSLSSTETRR
jgi:hypothetical protein